MNDCSFLLSQFIIYQLYCILSDIFIIYDIYIDLYLLSQIIILHNYEGQSLLVVSPYFSLELHLLVDPKYH